MGDSLKPEFSENLHDRSYRVGVRGVEQPSTQAAAHADLNSDTSEQSSESLQAGPQPRGQGTRPLKERVVGGLRDFAKRHKDLPGKIGKVLLSIAEAGVKLVPRLIGLVIGGLLGAALGIVLWAPLAYKAIGDLKEKAVKGLGEVDVSPKGAVHDKQWSDVKGLARVKAQAAMCLVAVGFPLIITFNVARAGKGVADRAVDAAGGKIRDACYKVANAVARARGMPQNYRISMQKES